MIFIDEFRSSWKTLVAGLLGNATGVGAILYYSMSSFMQPLETEFGWSRAEIGVAISCLIVGWITTLPVVGRLCDRYGPRRIILPSIPLLAAALAGLSCLQGQLWMLYAGFICCAVVGAGTLGITYIHALSFCFERHRGLAFGIALSGTGISAFVLPLLLHSCISQFGWRAAWLVLAGIVLLQFPVVYYFVRGNKAAKTKTDYSAVSVNAKNGMSFQQALLGHQFWILSLSFFCIASLVAGLLINMIALLRDTGITASRAAEITSLIGIGLLFARISIGFLLDYFPARYIAALAFILAAAGCLSLLHGGPTLAIIGALLLGFTAGAELDLLAFMSSRYFGMKNQGVIYGSALSIFYIGAMLGPVFIGGLYQKYGNYDLALVIATCSCLLATILIMFMGAYPRFAGAAETTS